MNRSYDYAKSTKGDRDVLTPRDPLSAVRVDLPPPDFAAMDERTFTDAIIEFLDFCDARHPHWSLWMEEQTRRGKVRREAEKANLRHMTPAYVDLTVRPAA